MKKKVAVGLSGGVDSAVAAALLKRKGYEVTAVYLHCFPESYQKTLNCTDKEDFKMAQKVAQTLRIPFTFFDFEKEYQQKVIEYFFQEYQAGRTPNPDTVCNKEIKFGLFLDRAIGELGVDFVATGHYARVISAQNGTGSALSPASKDRLPRASTLYPIPYTLYPNYHLLSGIDPTKDQSYFLYNLSQEQLSRVLFPIGEYTKKQVRQMARDFGLPNWDRKDSQGICFLGKISVRKFLEQRIKPKRGEVVDTSGRVIGEHDGVWFYTIGQRHGFRIRVVHLRGVHSATSEVLRSDSSEVLSATDVSAASMFNGPYYVIDKDVENNLLIVGWGKECERREFLVENVNWNTSEVCACLPAGKACTPRMVEELADRIDCQVRIRHLGELYPCQLLLNDTLGTPDSGSKLRLQSGFGREEIDGKNVEVVLKESAWGVAPGQVAVFYSGKELLGGGVIDG